MSRAPYIFNDGIGLIHLVDSNNIITTPVIVGTDHIWALNAGVMPQYPSGGFGILWGASSPPNGVTKIFVVDNSGGTNESVVYMIDVSSPTNWTITRVIGGQLDALGNPVSTPNALGYKLSNSFNCASDSAGNAYVTDFSNGVLAANMQSGTQTIFGVSINAGEAQYVLSSPSLANGYSGDGGPATLAKISVNSGYGVAVDLSGNLYFCDSGNNVIRKVTPTGTISTAVGFFPGTRGWSGDGGLATSALLNQPQGICCDKAGNLYIVDLGNNIIRAVNMQSSTQTLLGVSIGAGCIDRVLGTGTSGYSGDGGPARSAEISALDWAVIIDPITGNLLHGDGFRTIHSPFPPGCLPTVTTRIRMVDQSGIVNTVGGDANSCWINPGPPGHYYGDGGPATSAAVSAVTGFALPLYANFCGGMASQVVGQPTIKGTAKRVLG